MALQLLFHLEVLIAGYFLWLGLYILTRSLRMTEKSWYNRLDWHAALAMLLAAYFLLGIGMEFVSQTAVEYTLWLRLTWWALPPSAGLWFRLTVLAPHQTANNPIPKWKQWGTALVVFAGLAYGVANIFTDHFFAFSAVETTFSERLGTNFFVDFSPAYYIHAFYFLGVIYVTVGLWWRIWRQSSLDSAQKSSLQSILGGGLLIAVGASLTIFNYIFWDYRFPQPLSDLVAAVGLGIVGRNLIDYNAVLDERLMLSDYRRTFSAVLLYMIGMLGAFHGIHWVTGQTMSFVTVPLLVGTGIFLSTTIPFFQIWLNRWTLPQWEAQFLQELDHVEENILTATNRQQALLTAQDELASITKVAQDEQKQAQILEGINHIFRHNTYHKDEVMGQSELIGLALMQAMVKRFALQFNIRPTELSIENKAELLREMLQRQVAQLQPEETAVMTAQIEQQHIEYLILYHGYIDKRTREEIITKIEEKIGLRLLKNSRAYTLHLTRARQRLANQIWLAERALPVDVAGV